MASLDNPTPIQSRVTGLYQASMQSQQQAQNAVDMWSSWASLAGQYGFLGYLESQKAAKKIYEAGQIQADALQIAASQAGIAATDMYKSQIGIMEQQQAVARERVGSMKASYASAGLSMAGSPTLLMQQSIDQSLAEQRYTQIQGAYEERAMRQQQQNLVQQSNLTLQTAAQKSNIALSMGQLQLMQSQLNSVS